MLAVRWFLTELAERLAACGRNDEALAAVQEALDLTERHCDRWYERESRRAHRTSLSPEAALAQAGAGLSESARGD